MDMSLITELQSTGRKKNLAELKGETGKATVIFGRFNTAALAVSNNKEINIDKNINEYIEDMSNTLN